MLNMTPEERRRYIREKAASIRMGRGDVATGQESAANRQDKSGRR
jgi:hypothetical protein